MQTCVRPGRAPNIRTRALVFRRATTTRLKDQEIVRFSWLSAHRQQPLPALGLIGGPCHGMTSSTLAGLDVCQRPSSNSYPRGTIKNILAVGSGYFNSRGDSWHDEYHQAHGQRGSLPGAGTGWHAACPSAVRVAVGDAGSQIPHLCSLPTGILI
jgi:hypothetical protein